MGNEKRDFNKEAATWDEPRRARMATDIADAIFEAIPVQTGMSALDFGCGTGLLTLCLQPFVSAITGIDSSRGMLEVLEGKVRDRKLSNVKTLLIDPDSGARLEGRFDLITGSMAVHHVNDVSALLDQFYSITAPGGYLCIADLDPDGGLFHAENHQGVYHDGFDRNELHKMFVDAGYSNICDMTATKVIKPVPGGTREFTIFLMTGHKKP